MFTESENEPLLSEHFITFCLHNIGCMLLFAQVDYLLHYMKVKPEWCHLRAFGNGLIVACTWQDVLCCIRNHDISSTPPYNPYAESLVLSLYIYQCIIGKLQCQDPYYHAFVLIRTPVGYQNNNKTMSMLYFFCNGYPSMVDYTMLSMVLNGIVEKQTMKNVTSAINNYARKPGAALVASLLLHDAYNGHNIDYPDNRKFYSNILLSFMVYYKYATSRTKSIIKSK